MKKVYAIIFMALFLTIEVCQAQMSVLFVDDSDDTFGNAELIYAALDSVGHQATYYNAVDSAAGPSDLFMQNFDLVVWSTSTDGDDLYLWNGADEDNEALKLYLENGGNLWLLGNDFFFDRYSTNTSFTPGEFAYDYLGVSSYDVQTYVDDDSNGLPSAGPSNDSPITDLNELTWQFSTLWYADGVTLVDDAQTVYEMGDDAYVFSGKTCGGYYTNGTFQTLTYFFDLALSNNFNIIKENVQAVTTFFQDQISSSSDLISSSEKLIIYPNPANEFCNVEITLSSPKDATVYLTDINGRLAKSVITYSNLVEGKNTLKLNTATLTKGMYIVNVRFADGVQSLPIIIH